jgi:enoyl-CoA hydratase/carnithine racemase
MQRTEHVGALAVMLFALVGWTRRPGCSSRPMLTQAGGCVAVLAAARSQDPKFFCNGLDIEWMGSHPTEVMGMLESFWQWLGRLLTMDCHTVASISGHAFGAGAFLVLSCDYRLMRTGRGFLNFPEAALGMRLQKQFAEVAKAKLPPATLRTAMLEASRVGAEDALASGWVRARTHARTNLPAGALA